MVARAHWQGRPVCLMKLLTMINHAGPTLLPLALELGFTVKDCIFVHDDLDLPIGTVRARQRGSDGGHRGVQSIIQAIQDDQFRRIKIGIGKPGAGQSVADYVLTPFPPEQLAAIDAANHIAADRVMELIRRESISISKSSLPLEEPA
jgi:PTH1 family peptidyl-tRNA hydrolase